MKTIQIPKAKHKAGMKLFQQSRKQQQQVPQINMELRVLGFNDKEIEAFWKSNTETRLFFMKFEDEQRFLSSGDDELKEFCGCSGFEEHDYSYVPSNIRVY